MECHPKHPTANLLNNLTECHPSPATVYPHPSSTDKLRISHNSTELLLRATKATLPNSQDTHPNSLAILLRALLSSNTSSLRKLLRLDTLLLLREWF